MTPSLDPLRRAMGSVPIHLAYFLMALPTVIFLILLTPPFQVPDEIEHYMYSRAVSAGSILPRPLAGGGVGGTVATADARLVAAFDTGVQFHPTVKASARSFDEASGIADDSTRTDARYWAAAIYPPIPYFVPAAAMLAVDHLGLGRLHAFYAGRMANGVMFVLLATLAIWMMPCAKALAAFILLLPMTLFQAGSFSTDAFVFGVTAVTCAFMAREAVAVGGRPSISAIALLTILVAALTAVKVPLGAMTVPLAVLAARRSWLASSGAALFVLVVVALWTAYFALNDAQVARMAVMGDLSPSRQFAGLMASPGRMIEIATETLDVNGLNYFRSFVGVLGWLDTALGDWFYWLAFWMLAYLVVAAVFEPAAVPARERAAFLAAAVLGTGMTFAALYLTWTKVGQQVVDGVQGRYLIPLAIPLALALAGTLRRRAAPWLSLAAPPLLWVFATISLAHLTWVLVVRFYRA